MVDDLQPNRQHEPCELLTLLEPFGLRLASEAECERGRALAAELISPHVAPSLVLERIQQVTGSAIFVSGDDPEIDGVLAIVPLQASGVAAIRNNLVDPRNPPNEFLCPPKGAFAGLYGWGFAARSRKVSASIVAASKALRDHLNDIPFFSRAATPAGARVLLGRLGYRPYPGAPDGLLWNPVPAPQECAA